MNDDKLRTYFSHRLSNHQCNEVPDFDALFAHDGMLVPDRSVSSEKKLPTWWLWTVSAAACAALLLWFFGPADQISTLEEADAYASLPWQQETPLDRTADEPLMVEELNESAVLLASEKSTSLHRSIPAETIAKEALVDRKPATYQPLVEPVSEEPVVLAEERATSDFDQSTHSEAVYYERSIEEAHALAVSNKGRKLRPKVRLGLTYTQDNYLAQNVMNKPSQSTTTMVTRSYLTGHMAVGAEGGVRRTEKPNAWPTPDCLSKSSISSYTPTYHLPLSGSLGVSIAVAEHIDLQTGLSYTYLSANTSGNSESNRKFSIDQEMHYIGIPLKLAFRLVDKQLGVYFAAGGGIEKGLKAKQTTQISDWSDNVLQTEIQSKSISGLQSYVGMNLGVSYLIAPSLQAYVEPGFSYYFQADQPMSIRTKSPFNVSVGAGIRLVL